MHAMFVWVTPEQEDMPGWWNYLGLIEDDRVAAVQTAQENIHGEDTVASFQMPTKP